MGATQAVGTDFGQADGFDLALFNQLCQGTDAFLDWYLRVDAVQVVKIDDIGIQPPQAVLAGLRQDLGAAIHHRLAIFSAGKSALAREYKLAASASEVLADQALVMTEAVQ